MSKIGRLLGIKPPTAVAPAPPLPTRDDPELEEARRREREAESLRRGRRASIVTGAQGVTAPLGEVNRPQAGGSTLLGGG